MRRYCCPDIIQNIGGICSGAFGTIALTETQSLFGVVMSQYSRQSSSTTTQTQTDQSASSMFDFGSNQHQLEHPSSSSIQDIVSDVQLKGY